MLIVIKKWNLILLCAVFLLIVSTLGIWVRRGISYDAVTSPGKGKCVVLDAGHGAPDGGASGKNGVLEKDLNLAIVQFLKEYLEQGGVEVLLTRSDDYGIYDADCRTIRQKKRSDLENRVVILNESGADLFVSVHMNTFSDSKYSGPQVFYSNLHVSSKGLAEGIQKEMIAVLEPQEKRTAKLAGESIYLLQKALIPGALVECGFLSNPQEERLLQDETYQKRVAWAMYLGITESLAKL